VVKDKIVMEIVDLVKWVADDDDRDALNQLLASHPLSQVDADGQSVYRVLYIRTQGRRQNVLSRGSKAKGSGDRSLPSGV